MCMLVTLTLSICGVQTMCSWFKSVSNLLLDLVELCQIAKAYNNRKYSVVSVWKGVVLEWSYGLSTACDKRFTCIAFRPL